MTEKHETTESSNAAPNITLFREVVIGYVVTRERGLDGRHYHGIVPIIGDADGFFEETLDELNGSPERDHTVVGVLPALPNTFKITGYLADAALSPGVGLGYEFAGANNPDWERDCGWRVNREFMIGELWGLVEGVAADNHGEIPVEAVLAAAMEVPFFAEWRAYDVVDGALRIQEMLVGMAMGGGLERLREGVYALPSQKQGRE